MQRNLITQIDRRFVQAVKLQLQAQLNAIITYENSINTEFSSSSSCEVSPKIEKILKTNIINNDGFVSPKSPPIKRAKIDKSNNSSAITTQIQQIQQQLPSQIVNNQISPIQLQQSAMNLVGFNGIPKNNNNSTNSTATTANILSQNTNIQPSSQASLNKLAAMIQLAKNNQNNQKQQQTNILTPKNNSNTLSFPQTTVDLGNNNNVPDSMKPSLDSGSDIPNSPINNLNNTPSMNLLQQLMNPQMQTSITTNTTSNNSTTSAASTPAKTPMPTFQAIAEDSSISLTSLRGPVHTSDIHGKPVTVERITDRKGRVGFFLLGEQVQAIKARSKHNTAALFIKPIVKLDFGDGYTYDPTWRENATKMTRKKLNGQLEHPYERNGEKSWRCSQCNKGCTTRARTSGNDEIINVKYFCHHREHLHNFDAEMRYNCYSQNEAGNASSNVSVSPSGNQLIGNTSMSQLQQNMKKYSTIN